MGRKKRGKRGTSEVDAPEGSLFRLLVGVRKFNFKDGRPLIGKKDDPRLMPRNVPVAWPTPPIRPSSYRVDSWRLQVQRLGGREPNMGEIVGMARYLGIDPVTEPDSLWIAKAALMEPITPGWLEYVDASGRLFYVNAATQQATWECPSDNKWMGEHSEGKARVLEMMALLKADRHYVSHLFKRWKAYAKVGAQDLVVVKLIFLTRFFVQSL